MAKSHFSAIDIAIAIFSLLTYVVDIGTDIAAGVQYFLDGEDLLGWLTTAFVFVPAIVMSVFSLTWHMHDKTVKPLIVILHILPLAPVQRYARVVHLGLLSRKTKKIAHTQKAVRAQNDVSILRLIEAFMESAPQLVLQVYVMVTSQRVYWLSGLVAGSSLLSLSWAMTAYNDSLRKAHMSRYQQRLTRLVWHWGWQLFMVTSRIAAFVFLAAVINKWLLAVMGGHWLMAFIWISFKGTDFGNDFCERWLFRMVCAFIYIFVFMNLNDGMSRWRITAFYVIMFVENAAMAAVYLVSAQGGNLITVSCVTVFGGFILGLLCMLVYYGFFHPSGPRIKLTKPFQPKSRMFSVSQTSVMFSPGGGVQVFSLEPSPPTTSVGANGNVKSETASSQVSAAVKGRSRNSSLSSHRRSHAASSASPQQDLQRAWQCGIDSSSSDSSDTNSLSSLASDIVLGNDKDEARPPSRNSNNSDNSATSDNCLLPPLTRNDLSKSSEPSVKFPVKESVLVRKNVSGEVSGSDSVNIQSNTESPTLSRGSWARSSDYKSSHGVEDFVTLAFDDSSSTDRRGSDASSYSSRPKSLSPLDVTALWQDVHGKLRQTIAATIAAATGSISSNEGTPNDSRSSVSVSQNTTVSSQDENQSSFSQDSAIVGARHNSNRNHKNDINIMQNGTANSGRQREAMCSLPDILEAVENEPVSDISGSETSYSNSAPRRRGNSKRSPGAENRWSSPRFGVEENTAVNEIPSPYPEDSTLTASKLLTEGAKSYIHYTQSRHKQPDQQPSLSESQKESNQSFQGEEFPQDWVKGMQASNSPFTDQELVTVMANSLQSYMGHSTPATSISREREGLALTIEDLRFSPDSTTDAGGNVVRTRSTSSILHDSNNSSPASSASKMQRQAEADNKEAEKVSPNALKLIDQYPWRRSVDIPSIANSQALSILREAYAHSLAMSPRNQSSFSLLHSRKSTDDGRPTRFATLNEGMRKRRDVRSQDQNVCPKQELSTSAHQDSERFYGGDSPCLLEGDFGLFDSIAWRKAKLMAKKTKRANYVHGQGRQSSARNVSMHGTSFQMEEYSSSPSRPGHTFEVSTTDEYIEEYVKGKYCPPLCELSDNVVPKNLNRHRRSPLDVSSKWRHALAHTDAKNLSDEDSIGYLRNEIIRQDRRRNHQESDFFNLHIQNPDSPNRKKLSSVSQPNLRRKSQSLSPRKKVKEAENLTSEESPIRKSSLAKSYLCVKRSPSLNNSFDRSSLGSLTDQELETSARNVVDYFSQAIDSQNRRFSYDPTRHRRRNMQLSNNDLGVHNLRPPLRPLQNSFNIDP